jgi:hypothetical protein
MLQASSFIDGYFDGAFLFFRNYYFNLIDIEMKLMTNDQKQEHLEKTKQEGAANNLCIFNNFIRRGL